MFNPNILQAEINAAANAAPFKDVHFAIRKSSTIKALLQLADNDRPICIELEGKARQRASCVLAELIKQTKSRKNIFKIE